MLPLSRLAPLLVVALAGCPDGSRGTGPAPPRGPQVRAYTDSAPVTAVLAIHGYLVTGGPAGMDRFDLHTGARVHIGAAAGLPDDVVVAMVRDELTDDVWIATDRGLARYDPARDLLTALPPPSDAQGAAASGIRAIAADPEGGLWVGGPAGLFHVTKEGAWKPGGFTTPVRALHASSGGRLWIGTAEGLVDRRADGSYDVLGSDDGCAVTSVDAVFAGPDGGPVVLGTDDQQRSRIAFLVGKSFTTFKPSPEVRFVAGTRRMDDVVLATTDRLYSLAPPRTGARALRRDGLHLVAVAGPNRRSPYVIKPLDLALPTEITALAAASNDLYVGTRAVGTARYEDGGKKGARWLRRRDLVEGARDFSVACATARECYVATGTSRAWRFDGQLFSATQVATDPETVVLAMVRSPEGDILTLYREPEERRMHVGRLVAGGGFVPVAALAVETPGGVSALSFAEFSPDGTLWLGLVYLDEEGERRPYGVAVVDLSLNVVTYHHQQRGNDSRKTGILPLPNDVADIAFMTDEQGNLEEVWFATASGAARLKGEQVTVFTEAEGLDSEILHGIVITSGGVVFVASSSGVGEFDGSRWTWPRALAVDARTLALGKDGTRLWLGTDRGLAIFDGRRVQRVDVRAGQFRGAIESLAVDHLGRLWARSGQGIAIVTP